MLGLQRQLVALLLGGLDLGRRRAGLAAFGNEVLQAGIVLAAGPATSGCSADSAMNDAPNSVSGRVVKISSLP